MRGRCLLLLPILCFPSLAVSQNAASAATASGQQRIATPQLLKRPPAAPGSLDASGKKIRRITLEVNVTDAAGKPVAGLTPADFTVLDNGRPAKILSFSSVDDASPANPVQIVLLLDSANNTFQGVAIERDQVAKFLSRNGAHLPVPTSIALFSDSGIKIDQPTLNGNVLISALKKMPIPVRAISAAAGGEGAAERFQLSLRTLLQLLAYEGPKPGRKLLIWIGPGWPMLSGARAIMSERDQHLHWGSIVSFSTDLHETRTTLYSVDSLSSESGLGYTAFYKHFLTPATGVKDANPGDLALPVLALQSGGRVLYGSNDLAGEIASCVDDARTFYTLAIQISPSQTVNEYHTLNVKIAQPGLTARTSAGYYGLP